MAMKLYMDHNVPRAITAGLRIKGIDVISSYEDATDRLDDIALLERAGKLQQVLFTQDTDLLMEAVSRQRNGISFYGVVYAHQLNVSVGSCIHDLEILAKAGSPEDFMNTVIYLPL